MAAIRNFPKHELRLRLADPRPACASVSPSDSTDLTYVSIVRVGTAGDVKITDSEGNAVTIPSVQAGETLPVLVARVWSTGTTASGMTAFY